MIQMIDDQMRFKIKDLVDRVDSASLTEIDTLLDELGASDETVAALQSVGLLADVSLLLTVAEQKLGELDDNFIETKKELIDSVEMMAADKGTPLPEDIKEFIEIMKNPEVDSLQKLHNILEDTDSPVKSMETFEEFTQLLFSSEEELAEEAQLVT